MVEFSWFQDLVSQGIAELNQPFSQGILAQPLIKNQLFNLYALNCNLKPVSKLVASA